MSQLNNKITVLALLLIMIFSFSSSSTADVNSAFKAYKMGDETAAFNEFKSLAENGDMTAKPILASFYQNGIGTKKDLNKAFELFLEVATSGNNIMVFNNLAGMYYNGEGTTKDFDQAFYWYNKAAKSGDSTASYNLGIMYSNGRGVAKNLSKAYELMKIAAEANNADAQYKLGKMYDYAEGVEKNSVEAIKWYKKAADQGQVEALFSLGTCYEKGDGITQDYSEAIRLYRAAAKQNHTKAQFNLGVLYASGMGAEKDYSEAVKWYLTASEKAYPSALSALGYMYANGFGVKQDNIEALMYWEISASLGDEQAERNIAILFSKLSNAKQSEAQKMAKQWLEAKNLPSDSVGIRKVTDSKQALATEKKELIPEEIFEFMKGQASSGNSAAQFELSKYYLSGFGVVKSQFESEKWLVRSLLNDPTNNEYMKQFEKEFGWKCLTTTDNKCNNYINKDTIIKKTNLVWYWSFTITKLSYKDGKNIAFLAKSYDAINCDNNTEATKVFKLLNPDTMQTFEGIESNVKDPELEFKPLEPSKYTKAKLDFLCRIDLIKKESISTPIPDKTLSMGTGWPISKGKIVTNYHVIANKTNIKVLTTAGDVYKAEVYISDKANDIAILKIIPLGNFPPSLPISKTQLSIGTKVFTIGYPHPDVMGAKPKVTDGIISATSGFMDDPRVMQISVPVQSGNSGGPLLNMKGEVVGIVTAKLDASKMFNWTGDIPQNVNYAVKIPYLKALTDTANFPKKDSNVLPPSNKSLANQFARIQNSIMMIHAE